MSEQPPQNSVNPHADGSSGYCCAMRRHFLVGIVGRMKDEPVPIETADFIVAWEPVVTIQIKFCPFCGHAIAPDAVIRTVHP